MRLIAGLVLIVGLATAAAIYFTAEDEPQLSSSYVIVLDPAMTKTYVRDLERFGGKAAVLFDEFNRWFAARWHGKALGVTIAWLSIVAAALLFWISGRSRLRQSRSCRDTRRRRWSRCKSARSGSSAHSRRSRSHS